MTSPERFCKNRLSPEIKDLANWPQVDTSGYSEEEMNRFNKFAYAIDDIFNNDKKIKTICQDYGIQRSEFYVQLKRCLRIHPDGNIYGFRGLIKYRRIKEYTRTKELPKSPGHSKGGRAGALALLFKNYPKVEQLVKELFFKEKLDEIQESRIPIKTIHERFKKKCREEGIAGDAYPFNTVEKGRRALSNYLKKLFNDVRTLRKAVAARAGKKTAQKLGTGNQGESRGQHPLDEFQVDGHRIDASWVIQFPDRFRGMITVPCDDISLLCIKDVCSTAIFGFMISMNPQYNEFDLLRTFKVTVQPWEPKKFTIEGFSYPKFGGIPSMVIPDYAWATPDLVVLDNALPHLSDLTRRTLEKKLGCAINWGPVYNRDHQPQIENTFKQFASKFQRLPNTIGSTYDDSRKSKHPEKIAMKLEMTFFDLLEILEMSVAVYNSTPQESLDGLTPLEVLQNYAADDNVIIRKIRDMDRKSLFWLEEHKKVTVRGNVMKGRRPHINLEHAHYTNPLLASTSQMIGKPITVTYDLTADARTMRAFLENGEELGTLTVTGHWSRSFHTYEMRRLIAQKVRSRRLASENIDIVQTYLSDLFKRMSKNKKAASEIAQFFFTQYQATKELETSLVIVDDDNKELTSKKSKKSYVKKRVINIDETSN